MSRLMCSGTDFHRESSRRSGTARAIAERGMNTADAGAVRLFSRRIAATLRHHRDRGLLRQIKDAGEFVLWEIAR
jgi:hypothetical protein